MLGSVDERRAIDAAFVRAAEYGLYALFTKLPDKLLFGGRHSPYGEDGTPQRIERMRIGLENGCIAGDALLDRLSAESGAEPAGFDGGADAPVIIVEDTVHQSVKLLSGVLSPYFFDADIEELQHRVQLADRMVTVAFYDGPCRTAKPCRKVVLWIFDLAKR